MLSKNIDMNSLYLSHNNIQNAITKKETALNQNLVRPPLAFKAPSVRLEVHLYNFLSLKVFLSPHVFSNYTGFS